MGSSHLTLSDKHTVADLFGPLGPQETGHCRTPVTTAGGVKERSTGTSTSDVANMDHSKGLWNSPVEADTEVVGVGTHRPNLPVSGWN